MLMHLHVFFYLGSTVEKYLIPLTYKIFKSKFDACQLSRLTRIKICV